mgnify:CR=1 FL=1
MQYISKRTIISLTLAITAVALLLVLKLAYASSPPLVETGDFSLIQGKATLMGTITDPGGQDIRLRQQPSVEQTRSRSNARPI